jgi:hypothetical protein
MQNSHLRLGRLEYQRSGAKTKTSIGVPVSFYIGEKEQAHLLSYFGNDAEVAAITAAILEKHSFELHFPDGTKQKIGFGADPACYKGSLNLPEQKKSYRHIVAVSSLLHANGSAGRTFVVNDVPETQDTVWATLVSLLGIPADPRWAQHILHELRQDEKIIPIAGIGCFPSVVQATREEMLERIGRACASGDLPFPEKNGPIIWPTIGLRDYLGFAIPTHPC